MTEDFFFRWTDAVEEAWQWQTERLADRVRPQPGCKYIWAEEWMRFATEADHEAFRQYVKDADRRLAAGKASRKRARREAPKPKPQPRDKRGWHRPIKLKARPGVYALYDSEGRLLYIGSSVALSGRLSGHTVRGQNPGAIVKIRYTPLKTGEHLAAEFRLIRRLKPPLNRTFAR